VAVSYPEDGVAIFNLRLDDELAARFDAWAADRGGRFVVLRQLIDQVSREGRPAAFTHGGGERRPVRMTVRLSPADRVGLSAAAAEMGLTRHAWACALIRHRLQGRPTFPPNQEVTLLAAQTELRRIAVNINQIARAQNTMVTAGVAPDLELSDLDNLRAEIRGHMRGIFEALAGNHTYWSGGA
jgi:hypothetical protein